MTLIFVIILVPLQQGPVSSCVLYFQVLLVYMRINPLELELSAQFTLPRI